MVFTKSVANYKKGKGSNQVKYDSAINSEKWIFKIQDSIISPSKIQSFLAPQTPQSSTYFNLLRKQPFLPKKKVEGGEFLSWLLATP